MHAEIMRQQSGSMQGNSKHSLRLGFPATQGQEATGECVIKGDIRIEVSLAVGAIVSSLTSIHLAMLLLFIGYCLCPRFPKHRHLTLNVFTGVSEPCGFEQAPLQSMLEHSFPSLPRRHAVCSRARQGVYHRLYL